MRRWIGLIVVLAGAYYLWTLYSAQLGATNKPATPDVGWYLDRIEHGFAIVPERGHAWFFRGFHENKTTIDIDNVRVKVYLREGDGWRVLDTYNLGQLHPEQRKMVDHPIRVPRDADHPELRWEIVDVRRR